MGNGADLDGYAAGQSGCGDGSGSSASPAAAKVGKVEITVQQINFILQQQRGLRPEQADAASRQVLERLTPNPAVPLS